MIAWLQRYALVIAIAAAAAGWGAAGIQAFRVSGLKVDLLTEQRDRKEERRAAEEQARITNQNYRAEEQRREDATREALDEKEAQLVSLRADVAIRDAAAGRLQERVAALVARAREAAQNSAPAASGPPAEDATGMLADVLGRCISRVRLLADVADERGLAGQTCERVYDALSPDAVGVAGSVDARHEAP